MATPLKSFSKTLPPTAYVVTEGRISYGLGLQVGKNFSSESTNQTNLHRGLFFSALGDLNPNSSLYAEFSILKTQLIKDEFSSYDLTGTSFVFAYRTRLYKNLYGSLGLGSVYAFELEHVDVVDVPHKSLDYICVSLIFESQAYGKNIFYDLRFENYFTEPIKDHKAVLLSVGYHFGE